ncbi:MAG: MBOAT family protein [Clostridia bacterium]|nr:MBOAT family protein [Clostridia bacterium]
MVFADLLFIFLFLTLCTFACFLARTNRSRNWVLLVFSLIFYGWSGPLLVLLLCGMTLIAYLGALRMESLRKRQAECAASPDYLPGFDNEPQKLKKMEKTTLIFSIVLSIGILAFFKYTRFALGEIKALFHATFSLPDIVLPIGISFYTFQLISYLVDVYRGEVEVQHKYHLLLLYAGLFHQCVAGPIVRYSDINDQLHNRTLTVEQFSAGITRFATGLAKKALLANTLATIADTLVPTGGENLELQSAATLLLGSLAYMLQIYLDFSAYSDMAIGMGLMAGFHYRENFQYPYAATSVTDFWRRWHISLSSFFRDYVYIPLGGNRRGFGRQVLNMFIVWSLTGIWHGAGWNYLLWGLFYFVLLVIEKRFVDLKKKAPVPLAVIRRVLTLVAVFFGWILFRYSDMAVLGTVLRGIFCGNGNPFFDLTAKLTLQNNFFFLPLCILACFPVVPKLHAYLDKKLLPYTGWRRTLRVCEAVLPILLIVLSVCNLAGLTYNPFLYTQF